MGWSTRHFSSAASETGEARWVVVGLAERLLDLGQLLAAHYFDDIKLLPHAPRVRPGEIVRLTAATISALPFGTTAMESHMKCTRHRRRLAPRNTYAIAAVSPVWVSLATSWTPPRPRAFSRAEAPSRMPRPWRPRRTRGLRGVHRRPRVRLSGM